MLKRDNILDIGSTMVTTLRQHNCFSAYLKMDIYARNMGPSTLHLTLVFQNSLCRENQDSRVTFGVTGGQLDLIAEPTGNCYFQEQTNGWCQDLQDLNNLRVESDFNPHQASWRFQSIGNSLIVNQHIRDVLLVSWHNSNSHRSSRATAKFMAAQKEIQVCMEKRDVNTNQWVSIGDGNDKNKQLGICAGIVKKTRLAGGFSLVTLEAS